ncbi:discoidin domain-containing protein [Streptomyces sp. NPDC057684]|uniref:discoidin domain-containing protein n=1 Tax=Streptomyces sp. NPDC057684 TaxID=3346211 RepID=UPI0036CC755F
MATVPLDRTGWTATATATESGSSPANALDWNTGTRWSTGAQLAAGQWFKGDTGSSQWFNHIVLDSGASATDYPRGLTVEESDDNSTWRMVAGGEGSAVTTVNFPIVQARYVKVTLDKASSSGWSIAEMRVFSSRPAGQCWSCPAGAGRTGPASSRQL